MSEIKTRELVETACKEVTKKDVKLEIELKTALAKASAGGGR